MFMLNDWFGLQVLTGTDDNTCRWNQEWINEISMCKQWNVQQTAQVTPDTDDATAQ